METAIKGPSKRPLSERINIRMIVFLLAILAPIGFVVYTYLDAVISGGVHNRGSYVEADLKAMSLFPFDQNNGTINDIPKQWRELDGKRVQVVGEMRAPGSAAPEVRSFQVCYSIAKCCFSGPPQIQHFVQAKARKDPIPYVSGLVQFTGTMHVDVKHADGKVTQVYALDVDQAKPVQ